MKCCRDLENVGTKVARERQPFLDRKVRIRVPALARRELLQRGRQHADLHRARFEPPRHDSAHSQQDFHRELIESLVPEAL